MSKGLAPAPSGALPLWGNSAAWEVHEEEGGTGSWVWWPCAMAPDTVGRCWPGLCTLHVLAGRAAAQYRSGVSFFKNVFILFILFLAALGLRCCARAFSSCGEQGLLFVAVCGLLIVVASLIVEHWL